MGLLNPGELGISELRIPVPWGHIAVKAWGNPEGRRVLAVHGWMDNSGTFDALIPLLPQDLYILAMDVPGHGLSSHLPEGIPYHSIDLAANIRRVIRHLGWTRFHLMGHSMGAGLGLLYSTLYPEEVEGIVLIDLLKVRTNADKETGSGLASGVSVFLSQDRAQSVENLSPPAYPFQEALRRLMVVMELSNYTLTEAAAKALLVRGARRISEEEWTFNRDLRMMGNAILPFSHSQFLDMLKGLKCHVILVKAAEASWYNPTELTERTMELYKDVCPSFKLVKVSGNHFVHLNQPQRVSLHLVEFFNR